jgi:hypothetical protein
MKIPWRTGVNMREFAYYDRPDCLRFPQAGPPTLEAQLAALRDIGVPLVRFFAVHRNVDFETNLVQTGRALDAIQQKNMQAVVCIGDSLFDSGHTVPGENDFHRDTSLGHYHKRFWNERLYEQFYLKYVRLLTERFGSHPAVFAWELANELALHPRPNIGGLIVESDFNNFVAFVDTVSREIKQRSPKLVSTGIINTNQIAPDGSNEMQRQQFATTLYSLPNVDLISLHVYAEDNEDHLAMIDVKVANDLEKPFYVGELGANFEQMGNRAEFFRKQIDLWKNNPDRGAFSVMLWSFDNSAHDSGVGDILGFARRLGDFNDIRNVVISFAGTMDPFLIDAPLRPDGRISGGETGGQPSEDERIVPGGTRFVKPFEVVTTKLRIRSLPTRQSEIRGELTRGDTIKADPASRTEADENVWWEHSAGWSAERAIEVDSDDDILMREISPQEEEEIEAGFLDFPLDPNEPLNVNTLPLRDRLFQRLTSDPDLIFMLQYFGNTRFAFSSGIYDKFFQGLHPGLDLGSKDKDKLIAVFPGVGGTVPAKVIAPPTDSYFPRGVKVQVGDYVIIYGHLRAEPELVPVGTVLTPDTPIGHIATREDIAAFDAAHPERPLGFWPHLHLEIRFRFDNQTVILNPLLFFPNAIRERYAKIPPSEQDLIRYKDQFQTAPDWNLWGDPFTQPVIRFGKELIGPRAALVRG